MDKVTSVLILTATISLGASVTPFIVNFRYPPTIRRSLNLFACANLSVAVGFLSIVVFDRSAPLVSQIGDLGLGALGAALCYFSVRSLLERSFHWRIVAPLFCLSLAGILYGCLVVRNLSLGLVCVCLFDIVLFSLVCRDLLVNFAGRGRAHWVMGFGTLGFVGVLVYWGVALLTQPPQVDLADGSNDANYYTLGATCISAALGTINFLLLCNDEFNTRLLVLATTDPLTGVANRRRLIERGDEEIVRMQRYGHSLSAIVIDLDHFKALNDTHGHATGDLALRGVAEAWVKALRDIDLVARSGGEEFVVLLPQTILSRAVEVAERLRKAVAALEIDGPNGPVKVTASLGVADSSPADRSIDHLLARADRALYRSKSEGRDRVSHEAAESSPPGIVASPA